MEEADTITTLQDTQLLIAGFYHMGMAGTPADADFYMQASHWHPLLIGLRESRLRLASRLLSRTSNSFPTLAQLLALYYALEAEHVGEVGHD